MHDFQEQKAFSHILNTELSGYNKFYYNSYCLQSHCEPLLSQRTENPSQLWSKNWGAIAFIPEPETRQDFAPWPRFASKAVALGSLRFDSIFSKAISPRLTLPRLFSKKTRFQVCDIIFWLVCIKVIKKFNKSL